MTFNLSSDPWSGGNQLAHNPAPDEWGKCSLCPDVIESPTHTRSICGPCATYPGMLGVLQYSRTVGVSWSPQDPGSPNLSHPPSDSLRLHPELWCESLKCALLTRCSTGRAYSRTIWHRMPGHSGTDFCLGSTLGYAPGWLLALHSGLTSGKFVGKKKDIICSLPAGLLWAFDMLIYSNNFQKG